MQCGCAGKSMIHVLGRMEGDDIRFHHATLNGVQFKAYRLLFFPWNFPSHIFRVLFPSDKRN